MKLKWLEFFSIVFIALVTGVFWGTWFTLTRSLKTFSSAEFIHIGKTIIANVALPMRILMPATLLFILVAAAQSYRQHKPSFYLYAGSFLFMLATLIITVGVEVPIDNQIKTWTRETIPAHWKNLRETWDRFHSLRTFTSIISLSLFVWGFIKRIK